MATDNKKTKADPAPKDETAAKTKNTSGEDVAKTKNTSGEDAAKAKGPETGAVAPSDYSRGEGQKPVTRAYKENWNAIFAKKRKLKRKLKSKPNGKKKTVRKKKR
jgi:hypothetical protein